MTTSEQINEIAAACARAQLDLKPAVKDAMNPAFRSKYADMAAIQEASRVYAKHGVAVFQEPVTTEAGVSVATLLAHTSGQWIRFDPFTVPVTKKDAHGVGSATTYAKRYAKSAALSITADEDDDGNAASAPINGKQPAKVEAPKGYENWVKALAANADKGTVALQKFWKDAQPEYRQHLTATNAQSWEDLKSHAASVYIKTPEPVSA